jgi:hypothetical protein
MMSPRSAGSVSVQLVTFLVKRQMSRFRGSMIFRAANTHLDDALTVKAVWCSQRLG